MLNYLWSHVSIFKCTLLEDLPLNCVILHLFHLFMFPFLSNSFARKSSTSSKSLFLMWYLEMEVKNEYNTINTIPSNSNSQQELLQFNCVQVFDKGKKTLMANYSSIFKSIILIFRTTNIQIFASQFITCKVRKRHLHQWWLMCRKSHLYPHTHKWT